MRLKETESEFSIITGEEFPLSGKALVQLLKDMVNKKVSFRFKVKGFSMSPFIKDSDVVTVSPLSNSSIYFGRPVAFIHPETEKLVIHRVIGKKGDSFYIKGDRIPKADGLIPKQTILGNITKVEREGKKNNFGLGLERFIIAFLSRKGLLSYTLWRWGTFTLFLKRLAL